MWHIHMEIYTPGKQGPSYLRHRSTSTVVFNSQNMGQCHPWQGIATAHDISTLRNDIKINIYCVASNTNSARVGYRWLVSDTQNISQTPMSNAMVQYKVSRFMFVYPLRNNMSLDVQNRKKLHQFVCELKDTLFKIRTTLSSYRCQYSNLYTRIYHISTFNVYWFDILMTKKQRFHTMCQGTHISCHHLATNTHRAHSTCRSSSNVLNSLRPSDAYMRR